ncbi:MAG: NADH-quinone oxidoreductase subunit A [Candidatus Methanoplasma sp.]|jgi:NADH-quinone oxidoreductase subunit A|nr:NADH-quinone oxidoreductase subunit A [Candidatus Methanoplasma sp.]
MSLVVYYIPLVVVGLIAFGFAPLAWLTSRFVRPTRPTQWMEATYECGSDPIGDAHVQFKFQYYAFALIFVVFDLVATFLMIWAVAFSGLSAMATVWMLLFLGILILGAAYALKKEETVWI